MIVLDACVLIAFLDAKDAHHDRARGVMLRTIGEERGGSPITIAEVLVGPARSGQSAKADEALRELNIRQVRFRADAPHRLARLRAETRLKLPDCCVLLAAQDCGATAVATFDDALAAAVREYQFELLS